MSWNLILTSSIGRHLNIQIFGIWYCLFKLSCINSPLVQTKNNGWSQSVSHIIDGEWVCCFSLSLSSIFLFNLILQKIFVRTLKTFSLLKCISQEPLLGYYEIFIMELKVAIFAKNSPPWMLYRILNTPLWCRFIVADNYIFFSRIHSSVTAVLTVYLHMYWDKQLFWAILSITYW